MNIDIVETVKTAEVFLKAGARVSENTKKYVTRIGETFEFHKAGFNPEYLEETEKLCELAVHWVLANSNPIQVSEILYRR